GGSLQLSRKSRVGTAAPSLSSHPAGRLRFAATAGLLRAVVRSSLSLPPVGRAKSLQAAQRTGRTPCDVRGRHERAPGRRPARHRRALPADGGHLCRCGRSLARLLSTGISLRCWPRPSVWELANVRAPHLRPRPVDGSGGHNRSLQLLWIRPALAYVG